MEELYFKDLNKDHEILIDDYNKTRLLVNVFENLITKIKSEEDQVQNSQISEYYDKSITDYLILNKLNKEEEFNILFVNKTKLVDDTAESTKYNIDEESKMRMLSLFEEELRIFIKSKSKYLSTNKSLINDKSKEHLSILQKNFQEIFSNLTENFEIITDIFDKFKIKEIEEEKNEINQIEYRVNRIRDIMNAALNHVTDKITSNQTFKLVNKIKTELVEENEKLMTEMGLMRKAIDEYNNQGEELSNLVKEYKKICSLIELKK